MSRQPENRGGIEDGEDEVSRDDEGEEFGGYGDEGGGVPCPNHDANVQENLPCMSQADCEIFDTCRNRIALSFSCTSEEGAA